MFTHELAKRLQDTTVNCLHPLIISTNLPKTPAGRRGYATCSVVLYGFPPQKADTAVCLAASDQVANISGQYFKDRKPKAPAAIAFQDVLTKKMWTISEELPSLS
ncbi:hypothetical protein SAMN06265218_11233 [Fodinibius sediminis]|uniref:Uncharacterized protein n=2 Tax=Fodinibius sediminis TaxID=1214077 RepID=A0A521DX63_9BACT|nr:hypothetical protein SAMN06265218_11233 [Fodinibius sediminis]